ncbi:MAG TPA: 5-oxoprolinase subunit PxpA [Nevskiales bacterium]|nr:5-oxoprolinase subunit PxpA [Nevskiales bacterium]
MRVRIDLNADLGELEGADGLALDLALLEIVTSANVACGFHAGSPVRMQAVCAAAAARGVRIGAQVSYPDRAGFGRRDMAIEPAALAADVRYQIGALAAFGTVAYVKPHGALYNRVVWDEKQAQAVIDAVAACNPALPVLGLPDSALLRQAAAAGLPAIVEGFADRAYTPDRRLVPRGEAGAVLIEPEAVLRQALELARGGRVRSICLHSDTPAAVELARAVRQALQAAGFALEAFA